MPPHPRTRPAEREPDRDAPAFLGGSALERSEDTEEQDNDSDGGRISHETIQRIIQAEMADARSWRDEEISPVRAEAQRYFDGDLERDIESDEGRSSVTSSDLRDTVMAIKPSLLRVFLGAERPVELSPRGPGDEEVAKSRTDYINLVLFEDNPGFRILNDAFDDALTLGFAPIKWWWDESTEVSIEQYTGQTQEQVQLLADDPDVTDVSFEVDGELEIPGDQIAPDPPAAIPPGGLPLPAGIPGLPPGIPADPAAGAPPGAPGSLALPGAPLPELGDGSQTVPTHTVVVRRERTTGRFRFQVLPGEEFFLSRNATSLEDASVIAHLREVTRSDLIALGYDREFIKEHEGRDFTFASDEEHRARWPRRGELREPEENEDLTRVLYGEVCLRYDEDGDGIAERHKVSVIGPEFFVARTEHLPEINFTILSPDPRPHKALGEGMHQSTRDIARIKTAIMRAMLDSLRMSIDAETYVNEDLVNIDDLLNKEVGRVVRVQGDPNQVVRIGEVPFTGQAGLVVLDYLDGIKEARTGITKTSQGLDADAMQSTTKAAISAQLTAAQQRIEMISRIIAETAFKDLVVGCQKMLMRHQDAPRLVRLRGQWVEMDPRTWDAAMDVTINVGLGTGIPEERIQRLVGIKETQESVLQTLGSSPLVSFEQYRNTLAKLVELAGYADATPFFGDVPPGWTPPSPPEKPDPAMIVAQAQAAETQAKITIEQAKLVFAREQLAAETGTARMKLQMDMQLGVLKLEAETGRNIEEARVNAALENVRVQTDADIRRYEADSAERQAAAVAAAPAPEPPASFAPGG